MFGALSRRTFVKTLAASAVAGSVTRPGLAQERVATAGMATEWAYESGKQYSDPFNRWKWMLSSRCPRTAKNAFPHSGAVTQAGMSATLLRLPVFTGFGPPTATPPTAIYMARP